MQKTKTADTLSEKIYDNLLNTLTFFFGMDVSDIESIPDITDDKQKALGLESYTDYLQEVDEDKAEPEIPKVKEIEEEVEVVEPEIETGVVERNKYKIHLPPMLAARIGDPAVDHSYPALKYLESLGYKTFDFVVNPHHKKNDICDEIARANPWELTGVLDAATEDAEAKAYPVAPIFNLTHINSKGYFHVYPPSSVDDIPDDAPGLVDPLQVSSEELFKDKQNLLARLMPVDITRFTFAPHMFEQVEQESEEGGIPDNRNFENMQSLLFLSAEDLEYLKTANFTEAPSPIVIKKDIFIKQPMGFMQLLLNGFRGFLLGYNDEVGRAYIYDLDNVVDIPMDVLDIIYEDDLIETNADADVKPGNFVSVDGELGITVEKSDSDLIVYSPIYGGTITTDTWKVLEIK